MPDQKVIDDKKKKRTKNETFSWGNIFLIEFSNCTVYIHIFQYSRHIGHTYCVVYIIQKLLKKTKQKKKKWAKILCTSWLNIHAFVLWSFVLFFLFCFFYIQFFIVQLLTAVLRCALGCTSEYFSAYLWLYWFSFFCFLSWTAILCNRTQIGRGKN